MKTSRPKTPRLFAKCRQAILASLFMALLGAPVVTFLITESPDLQKSSERQLEVHSGTDVHLVESFELLKFLDSFGAWIRYYLLGFSPNQFLYRGRDGWFIRLKGWLDTDQGRTKVPNVIREHLGLIPFSDSELRHWGKVLEQRRRFLKRRGIEYVFAVAPRKTVIYPEIFPELVRRKFKRTRLRQLTDYLKAETDVHVVDLAKALKEAKERDDALLYLKTDGHWNPLGAYWAYNAIMHRVDRLFPNKDLAPMPLSSFKVRIKTNWSHRRFTRLAGIRVFEPYPLLTPKAKNPLLSIPVLRKGRTLYQPRFASWRRFQEESLLLKRGAGFLAAPITHLTNREGRRKQYRHLLNYGTAPIETVMVMGDSFLAKLLYFFAGHSKRLFRTRELLGFNGHYFSVSADKVGSTELVIQGLGHGALVKKAPYNPPVVSAG